METFDVSTLKCYGNYVWNASWLLPVLLAIVLVLITILFLCWLHMTRSVDAVIVCTLSEAQLQQGNYIIQIDISPAFKAGEKLKQRKNKGFISKGDNFFGGGKSTIFKVKKGSMITFTVEGALKPMTQMKEGQNQLKCLNIQRTETSRQLHLVPSENRTDDKAAITFFHNGEFHYEVTLTNIPTDETAGNWQMSTRSCSMSSTGSAATIGVEALPLKPRPPGRNADDDVVSVRTGQRVDDEPDNGDEVDGSKRRRHRRSSSLESAGSSSTGLEGSNISKSVLSDSSLQLLSRALGPSDATNLLRQLEVADAAIQYEHHNHPRDGANANAKLLIMWRKREIEKGEVFLRQEMERGLRSIHRNDIREVFRKCANENIEITADDLKGIMG